MTGISVEIRNSVATATRLRFRYCTGVVCRREEKILWHSRTQIESRIGQGDMGAPFLQQKDLHFVMPVGRDLPADILPDIPVVDGAGKERRPALGLTIPNTLRKLGIVADPGFGGRWMENYGKYAGEAAFFDGVEETLAALKAGGYSLGIFTSRCREEYEAFFSSFRLESRFGCIVLADETKRHKPDPEPLLKYAQKAGVLHVCGGYADGCRVRQPGGNGRKNFFLFQERCSIIRLYYDGSISGSFYCMSESQFLIRFRSDTNDQKQRRRSKLK